jgi:four helix bundle protein
VGIERFEDLRAWQEARGLMRTIYRFTQSERFALDKDLRSQLQGAAIATMSHIAEAHGRSSPEETRRCLEIALGAGKEIQSHLYVGLDQAYLTLAEFQEAYGQADRVAGRIGGMLGKLDRQVTGRPARPPSRQKRA